MNSSFGPAAPPPNEDLLTVSLCCRSASIVSGPSFTSASFSKTPEMAASASRG